MIVEPADPRVYLEEITATVNRLAHEQGGSIPFTVVREIVENFIHATVKHSISVVDEARRQDKNFYDRVCRIQDSIVENN